jgi:hypothetical protein
VQVNPGSAISLNALLESPVVQLAPRRAALR